MLKKMGTLPVFFVILLFIVAGFGLIGTDKPILKGKTIDEIITYPSTFIYSDRIDFNNNGTRYAYSQFSTDGFYLIDLPNSNFAPKSTNLKHSEIFLTNNATDQTTHPIMYLEWSPNGDYIVSVEEKSTIAIWDVSTTNPFLLHSLVDIEPASISSNEWSFRSIRWAPDSTKIAITLFNSTVIIWDINSGAIENKYYVESVQLITWSNDANFLAITNGSSPSSVLSYDHYSLLTLDLKNNQVFKFEKQIDNVPWSIEWTISNQIIITHLGGKITFWDVDLKKLVRIIEIESHYNWVWLDESNNIIISTNDDDETSIISLSTTTLLTEFKGITVYHDQNTNTLFVLKRGTVRQGAQFWKINEIDYSDIERQYDIYQYKIFGGYLISIIALVPLVLSVRGLFRRFSNYAYVK